MYNGNFQQNPLCVKSCVTKEFSISFRFSPTIFDPDANSVFLRAHICTAVDSVRRKPCVRNCSREREGLYNGNVQQNHLCAASCHEESSHLSPVLASDFLSRCKISTSTSTPVVVVVFFTLTDRASTIPNNTRGCQSGTWSAGQKNIRGTSTKLQ